MPGLCTLRYVHLLGSLVILLLTILSMMRFQQSSVIIFSQRKQKDSLEGDHPRTVNNPAVWAFRNDSSAWCHREESKRSRDRKRPSDNPGLLLVKVPKTASSTLVGINLRIAHKIGEREQVAKGPSRLRIHASNHVCSHTRTHGRDALLASQRSRLWQPLLWSFVRDPATRVRSAFYHFEVSRKGVSPTLGHLTAYASDESSSSNYQYTYLSTHHDPRYFLQRNMDQHINLENIIQDQILTKYDFVGLVERWTESLAVMVLLWNLKPSDVIVLPSKVAGGFDDGRYQTAGNCKKIVKASSSMVETREDEDYLEYFWNTTFRSANEYDYQLYTMVDEKLTKTILALGTERVEAMVKQVQVLEALATEKCSSSAIFPCSSNGTWQYAESKKDCYWYDCGCGYPCIDKIISPMANISRV